VDLHPKETFIMQAYNSTYRFIFLAASVFLPALSACGTVVTSGGSGEGDSGPAPPGQGPVGGTSTGGTSTGGTSGGSTGTGPVSSDCAAYCAVIAANCAGSNEQYAELPSCMGVCATFPPGQDGDTAGNSLACRAYHATAAKMDPATHCGHAGPTGGDLNPQDQAAGPCGDGCEAFCNTALNVCTGTNQAFNDLADCLAQCKTFKPAAAPYSMYTWNMSEFHVQVYTVAKAADPGYEDQNCPALGVH
jgi:hypothetical protein